MDDVHFPPRELEVMSVLWRRGSATVNEVKDDLEEPLAYTSVLSALQTLEEKGYVRHESEGRAYRYFPTVAADRAGKSALSRIKDALDEPLAYTSVLSALQTLEEKGYVRHEPEGRAYRYFPTVGAERAGGSALARIRDAIFQGSAERMFAQFVSDRKLGREELERMRRLLAERLKEEP